MRVIYLFPFLSLLILPLNALTVSFSRRLDTCDEQDQALTDGTTKFVYAYSSQNPSQTGGNPTFHEQQGTRSARIMEGKPAQPVLPSDARTLTFAANNLKVPFPQDDPTTSYYCTIFAINITSRAHIVQWEPVFSPKENVQFVHHILMYECPDAKAEDVGYSGICYDPNFKFQQCQNSVVSAWAVGGAAFNYPEDIGYPVGTADTVRYVMMETHYNNPNQVPITDSSGMKYVITNQLRKQEAGTIVAGYNTDPSFTIPPGLSDSVWNAPCPSACTQAIFPKPVKILATLLHMHTTGKAIKTRHVRNGTELKPILSDPYYDFNFQDFEYLATPRDLFPGDELVTECHYDTTKRKNITHFGLSTREEMCLSFHIYVPRTNTKTACMFGNYTGMDSVPPEYRMAAAFCGNLTIETTLPNVIKPLPITNCTRSTPTTSPSRMALSSDFHPESYERQLYLDGDDSKQVSLWWTVDQITQMIHFALQVNVEGWMGLGFSPTGGMINSDVITFWKTSNQTLHVEDRFALQHSLPPIDAYQDIVNIVFYEGNANADSSSSSKLSNAAIIGIAVGGGGGVLLALIVIVCCYKSRQHHGLDRSHDLLKDKHVNSYAH